MPTVLNCGGKDAAAAGIAGVESPPVDLAPIPAGGCGGLVEAIFLTLAIPVAITAAGKITITSAEGNGVAQAITDVTVSRGTHAPVGGSDIKSSASAATALGVLDTAIEGINSTRASLGASMSRLEFASDNLQNVAQNSSAARSRVLDADYAAETTELARTQIIQQAATAMLSQANQSQQAVLALLK